MLKKIAEKAFTAPLMLMAGVVTVFGIVGGAMVLIAIPVQMLMSPVQWWNGPCSAEYVRSWRSAPWWYIEPSCTLPQDWDISPDELQSDLQDLKEKQRDIDREIAETQERLDQLNRYHSK